MSGGDLGQRVEYSCAHGAQINTGGLTLYLTYASVLSLKNFVPQGDIGTERPFLVGGTSAVFLLTGKPENGGPNPTNSIQVMGTVTASVIDLVLALIWYCGSGTKPGQGRAILVPPSKIFFY
jgi:hypothetical protein